MVSESSKSRSRQSRARNRDNANDGVNAPNPLNAIPEDEPVDLANQQDEDMAEVEDRRTEPTQAAQSSGGVDPAVLQQIMTAAMENALNLYKQKEAELMQKVNEALSAQQSPVAKLNPFEQSMLRGLTDMQMFNGEGTRTWDDFQKEFANKASMIPSLPRNSLGQVYPLQSDWATVKPC